MDALKIISEGSIKSEKPQFNVGDTVPVSYTHLDVYKRQKRARALA